MSETNAEFMERLRKQDEERRAQGGTTFPKSVVLKPETNVLYKLKVNKAFGVTGGEYDDSLGLAFDEDSPVCKGFKSNGENTVYFNRGVLRTIRSIVFRNCPDNTGTPKLVAGHNKTDKTDILVGVPVIDEPMNIQFVIVEDEAKDSNKSGFKHAIGEVVDTFATKWEDPAKFFDRLQKEKQEYLDTKFTENQVDGKKLGHTEIGVGKVIIAHVIDAFASNDGTHGIVRIDPDRSPLWEGYNPETDGVFNRIHMSGTTLKTFRAGILAMFQDKDGSRAVLVGKKKDKNNNEVDEFIRLPSIPAGGKKVMFFREARYPLGEDGKPNKEANQYKVCLGEVLED